MPRPLSTLALAGALAALPFGSPSFAAPAGTSPPATPSTAGAEPAIDFKLTSAQIAQSCTAVLVREKAAADQIARLPASQRTFATVVAPLETINADVNDDLVAQTLLFLVSTDPAVRTASQHCREQVDAFFTELSARAGLYGALKAAKRTATTRADRKLTDLWLATFLRSGAGLPPDERARFVKDNDRLNVLMEQFGATLANDHTTITLTRAEAAGLPSDFLATLAPARGLDGYTVPVNESTVSRFLANASDSTARKAYFLAYNNRGVPTNDEALEEAIGIRDRLARELDYPNWAAYVLADRMAGSPDRVRSFLSDLDAKLLPRATSEFDALAALKAQTNRRPTATLDPWDVVYYDNLLRKTKYDVDDAEIRRYFPADHVVPKVLDIYATVLGVRFTQRSPANVWDPHVTEWSVSDAASGRYIGELYLDLFPRDGKYTHVASFPLLPNRRLPSGAMRPPVDAIIGNWPAPAPGEPALLSHDDVVTFFHEFGHAMATLLATTPYETLSAGFRWDFVEAPSQMLENFAWDPGVLKAVSSNVTTGAPLPDSMIRRIVDARYVNEAYFTTRQIMLATIDLDYHTTPLPLDLTAIWFNVAATVTPLHSYPGTHPEASFTHLMGGYDAGYYGYLWSRVYAQDLFTEFASHGVVSAAVGARYRSTILEPARELEPDDEVKDFLGRPMRPDAFYRDLGIP